LSKRLTTATDQLIEAEDVIKKMEAQLKDVEGKEADSLRKTSKAMTDSIKGIRDFINGKKQEKQGYGTPYQLTVMDKLFGARGATSATYNMPDAQTDAQIKMAADMVQQAIDKVNKFFGGKWKDFQKQYDAYNPKIFNEFKPVE
jgi:hypothetical protein